MRQLRSILLTGGAGFIGSCLARHLLEQDGLERLVVLDKLTSTGSRGNLIGPDHDSRFEFVQGDILDHHLVADLLRKHASTGVFHLAAETHVDRSIEDPTLFVQTNVTGTAHVLEACRTMQVPLLHCSTEQVHGSIAPPGRFQEQSPLNPSSPYAASKAAADLLCLAAGKTYGQDVVITRCSTNYGPRQQEDKLIPKLVNRALRDEPLPIYGDGMAIRDWIHVDDHCRGLLAAFVRGRRGGIHLFGGKCERTNLGIARDVLQILGKSASLLTFVPDRPAHDRRYAVDVSQSMALFGWQPRKRFKRDFPGVVRGLAANWSAA